MTPMPTIYVIEDEEIILDLMETFLTDGGYGVRSFGDSSAAMAEIEIWGAALKAMVTDIRLGYGPSGWALADRAHQLSPDVCVVYVTGDSTHEWKAKGVPHSVVLTKPFAAAELVAAIKGLLDTAESRMGGH